MLRRSFRRGLRLGVLVGVAVAVVKAVQSWRAAEEPPAYVAPPSPWPPVDRTTEKPAAAAQPEPVMEAATFVEAPAVVEPAVGAAQARIWVEPSGTVCPPSHPIKAKLSSKLFHLPGMFAYDRCKPDRCYATEPDAVADGLQKAKR